MQDLIARVVQSVGIDEATAKPAIGVILQLLKSVLPEGTASSLMGALPGAESLLGDADQAGSGGIGGLLGGAMSSLTGGSAGAITQAMSQLQGLGSRFGPGKRGCRASRRLCQRACSGRRQHRPR